MSDLAKLPGVEILIAEKDLSVQYPEFIESALLSRGLRRSSSPQFIIAWNELKVHYRYHLTTREQKNQLPTLLSHSQISNTAFLIIEFSYDAPVIRLPTATFLQHFNTIFNANSQGFSVISDTGSEPWYLEIVEWHQGSHLLCSNFPVEYAATAIEQNI